MSELVETRIDLYEGLVQGMLSRWTGGGELSIEHVERLLPFVHLEGEGERIILTLIAPFRKDLPKFFHDMVVKWLLPGRELAIKRFFSERRALFPLEEETGLFVEVECMRVRREEWEEIEQNFPHFAREVKLGAKSLYHARKLLEIKYLTNDEKVSAIQERVSFLLSKFPSFFDYDVFDVMQRFILSTTEEYKRERTSELLAKVILTTYLFMQKLSYYGVSQSPKRHLLVKLVPGHWTTPFGNKHLLGVFVGLSFLKDHEFFEKKHLLRALEKSAPEVDILEESYFCEENKEERTLACYLEIAREKAFTRQEMEEIKESLQNHVKHCIESLVRPVFMPKNEEETMKYIVTLSKQIRHKKDLPQIVVAFDEQDDRELFFTVICVRPITVKMYPIMRLPALGGEMFRVQIEKIKTVKGSVPVEVSVLKVSTESLHFLRDDFVVDLFRARESLIGFLEGVFGEIRDYNGGMLSKQKEVFASFKEGLLAIGEKEEGFLEQFFYSLFPLTMRSIVHLELLTKFYLGLKEFLERGEDMYEKIDKRALYLYQKCASEEEKEEVLNKVGGMGLPPLNLLHFDLSIKGNNYLGWLYLPQSEKEREVFIEKITCL